MKDFDKAIFNLYYAVLHNLFNLKFEAIFNFAQARLHSEIGGGAWCPRSLEIE